MEERGVACGLRGGNMDWKIVVTSVSRCLGTAGVSDVGVCVDVVKLFMTSCCLH